MATQRRTVHFSGHVQGVGFRYTALRTAGGFDVSGYVRNLPDGRVELVAEGEPDEIDAMLEQLRGRMRGHIRDEQARTSPATGSFNGFDVRY
jgi:acylphosphatase